MTVEDRIRTSMAAKVESPPELPGLYGVVADRVRVLRRRRRTAAAVTTCALVVAVGAPLMVGGASRQTTPIAPNASLAPATTSPSVPPSPEPIVTKLSGPASSAQPAPLVSRDETPSPPPVPLLGFPLGAAPALPLLIANGNELRLQEHGSLTPVGPAKGFGGAVQAQRRIFVNTGKGTLLIAASGTLTLLPGTMGWNCPTFATPDGRYLVLGRQAGLGPREDGADTLAGDYALYDIAARRILDQVHEPKQGCAAAVISDGRILMTTGDGAVSGAALWTPSSGLLSAIDDATVRVVQADGPTTSVRVVGADGDGCGYYQPGTTGTRGYLGVCGQTVGAADLDISLPTLLARRHLAMGDWVAVDRQHVQLLVSRTASYNDLFDSVTYRWVLTCAVPVKTALTCVQNQQFAPVVQPHFGDDPEPSSGPVPYLVH